MATLLNPQEIKYEAAHLQDSKTQGIVAGSSILISVATVAVILRLWARKIRTSEYHGLAWASDDYLVLVALLFAWAMFGAIIYSQ